MDTTSFTALAELLSRENILCEATPQLISQPSIASGSQPTSQVAAMPQQVGATPQAAATLAISGAACDSRVVAPGNVFICKGAAFKPAFLTRALEAGASCYLCDQVQADELLRIAPTTARLVVNDIRKAMAIVSAAAWGHPDTDLRIAGMTGTKGKSTVAYMLRVRCRHRFRSNP